MSSASDSMAEIDWVIPEKQVEIVDVSLAVASGSSSCSGTSNDCAWDKQDNRHSTNISLSSLPDQILEAFPQTGGYFDSSWITLLEATDDLGDGETSNLDTDADAVFFPAEPAQEDWTLCDPGTPSLCLSSIQTANLLLNRMQKIVTSEIRELGHLL